MSEIRVGHGFDVHRLVENRPLVLGGVEISYEKGLQGHSDADVLLHAICDALLGAAGLADIGTHFPAEDPKYKDADSTMLLAEVRRMLTRAGFDRIVNLDTVIMAEKPKLAPYVDQMKMKIAEVLQIEPERVGIKATTTEGLGFTGREEGIAASAVCLIEKDV